MRPSWLVLVVGLSVVLGGCASRRQKAAAPEVLDAEALLAAATAEIESGNPRKAKQLLEKVQYAPGSRSAIEPLVRLALADTSFLLGDDLSLIDARSKYLDFVTLYGDHPRAAYAQLQAGLCSLQQVAHPSRDQTQTLVALGDFSEVLRRFPTSPYAAAATDRIREAEARLAEQDFLVGRFYFKRKSYLAAIERFRGVLSRYPRFPGKEKVYYYLGEALVRNANPVEGRLYLEKLLADYPTGTYAPDARRTLERLDEAKPADSSARRGSTRGSAA